MRGHLTVISFFIMALCGAQPGFSDVVSDVGQRDSFGQKPEFYVLEWKQGELLTEKETPLFIEVDSMGRQEITMLVDKKSDPVLYSSNIETPVCADGECRLMHIKLYWTLLGDYAGFDRYPGLPLTKHDHDEFLKEDYLKLHFLLSDKLSILERRTIDELVVEPEQPELEGADALSGATIAEVKESVVAGALYSCYVAWHLVHGAIQEDIKKLTLAMVNDEMVLDMLNSSSVDYQMFALNRMGEDNYVEYYGRIAEIFGSGIPMVRTFIVKSLPDIFWDTEELQGPFWKQFANVDINSRSLLLEHLNATSDKTLEDVSFHLGVMTKNQLKVYLEYIADYGQLNSSIRKNLQAFSKSNSEKYAYLVTQFLEDYTN